MISKRADPSSLGQKYLFDEGAQSLGLQGYNASGWNSDTGHVVKKFYRWFVLIFINFVVCL